MAERWRSMMQGLERFKSTRVALVMVALNLIGIAGLFAYYWDARSDRLETAAEIMEWKAAELYAPTALTVRIAETPGKTRVVERAVFDGPRIRQSFGATWVTRLRSLDEDSVLCTMPQTGPRWSPYQTTAPRQLNMTWTDYTGDSGACFSQMQPCSRYDLWTIRQAEAVIDGITVRRDLPTVQSEPFVFPGDCEE